MADPTLQQAQKILQEMSKGSEEGLRTWLRERDRMGALPETQAALDEAFARGYARGIEEGNAERLDALRTLLLRLLEAKFGELSESALDTIEQASQPNLERWMLALLSAASAEETLAD